MVVERIERERIEGKGEGWRNRWERGNREEEGRDRGKKGEGRERTGEVETG